MNKEFDMSDRIVVKILEIVYIQGAVGAFLYPHLATHSSGRTQSAYPRGGDGLDSSVQNVSNPANVVMGWINAL